MFGVTVMKKILYKNVEIKETLKNQEEKLLLLGLIWVFQMSSY